jgi:hypothetical protein
MWKCFWEDWGNPHNRVADASVEIRTAPVPNNKSEALPTEPTSLVAQPSTLYEYFLISGAGPDSSCQPTAKKEHKHSSFCVASRHEGITSRGRDRIQCATVAYSLASTLLTEVSWFMYNVDHSQIVYAYLVQYWCWWWDWKKGMERGPDTCGACRCTRLVENTQRDSATGTAAVYVFCFRIQDLIT